MSGRNLIGVILLTLGLLGLVHKGFEYTKEVHKVDVGPVQIRYSEKEYVDVPLWAGVACIAAGAACMVIPGRKTSGA